MNLSRNIAVKSVSICLVLGLLTFGFQNCTPMTAIKIDQSGLPPADDTPPPVTTPPPVVVELNGRTLYAQYCIACHGSVESSTKLNKSAFSITAAINEEGQMNPLSILTPAQIQAIADVLAVVPPPPPAPEPKALFTCTPSNVQKTPLLRLTNREFRASINSLLDGFNTSLKNDSALVQLLNNTPTDIVTTDRDTLKEQALLNSQAIFNNNFETAFRAGQLVSGHSTGLTNYPNTNQCLGAATVNQTCHTNFVTEFSRVAFRRPLTSAEITSLASSLWSTSLSKVELIQSTVAAMILMPEFGYKAFDRGNASAAGNNIRDLTAHELAAKISYLITGGPPDSTLRSFANSGQILNNATLSTELDRLLALPSARSSIARLFRESFGYDVYDNFIYLQSYLGGVNTSGLQQAMTQELDDYFYNVIVTQRGTFADLFNSTTTNITHGGLASIYNVSTGATTLPRERAGFLNRAAMLTKRSGFNASPIKRGLKVLEHVLCEEVGLPPPSAPTSLPTVSTPTSTRIRTELTTEAAGTSCVACHSRMNPFGYALEQFDSLGRIRSQEVIYNSDGTIVTRVAINTRTTSSELGSQSVSIADASDLAHELGRSDKAMMCFMKNLKKFESRVSISSASNCHMNQGLSVLYQENNSTGRVVDAIKSFIIAPEFRRWSY